MNTSRISTSRKTGHSRRLGVALTAAALAVAACGGDSDDADESATTTEAAAVPTSESITTTPATTEPADTTPSTEPPVEAPLAINHLQLIGSHNSYHLKPEQVAFDGISAVSQELAESIEYSHRPLTEQLEDFGIRHFELDVFADPEGGLFSNRVANAVVGLDPLAPEPELQLPGYKVLHTQDYDYRTTCLTLVACLGEIDVWSEANPNHLPMMIMIEVKTQSVPEAAAAGGIELTVELPWTVPLAMTPELLDALDAEISSVFDAEQIISPDDVRGDAATLETAVLEQGWPTIEASRGKVLFLLNNGGEIREFYLDGRPNLEGRPMFTSAAPGDADAAFVRLDDPNDPTIAETVETGYLVRTRTDSPTADARANDTADRDAAFESGAQFLSTDYYEPSVYFDSPYVVAFPNGAIARCNPVSAPTSCTDDQLTE